MHNRSIVFLCVVSIVANTQYPFGFNNKIKTMNGNNLIDQKFRLPIFNTAV